MKFGAKKLKKRNSQPSTSPQDGENEFEADESKEKAEEDNNKEEPLENGD